MLEVNGISKYSSTATLLDNVSFYIKEGSVLGILGPSGSGKTTLLRIIAGLETPAMGSIVYNGVLLTNGPSTLVPPEKRGIVMAFQDTALFPHLSVKGNVGFGLAHLPASQRAERIEEELERFGITHLKQRRVIELSGGELQRVSLARALAVRPAILLLDEPFSNVDRLVRIDLIHCLNAIFSKLNTTVILVTHDARDALELADSVLLLKEGRVVVEGNLQTLADGSENMWVRSFLTVGIQND